MNFFKKKCKFSKSLGILGKEGFTENYVSSLKSELAEAERPQDIAKGKSFLANALMILGNLTEAYAVFEEIDMKKLEHYLRGNLVGNMIFCKFAQDDFAAAEGLYQKYNAEVLGENGEVMKRSLGIHQHIQGRYEVAVEIFVKMLDGNCRFLDICMVKSLLRLNMYERAREFAAGFDRYKDCGELAAEVQKLRKKIKKQKK
ncbi:MAG: hypothetical protein NC253_11545 [Ruminococcus sp.]|nr:hypothetical protein [Ruminococcus sp.]MCM1478609.1 hypothetical protein [Muribaculaceae bacterium]